MRSFRILAAAAALICGIGVFMGPVQAEDEKKKHDNCLIVKGVPVNSTVYLEYKDGRGNWQKKGSKTVLKDDEGVAMFCGLKPGTVYRLKGRKEGDDGGKWGTPFPFKADKTGAMEGTVTINMPPQQPPKRK